RRMIVPIVKVRDNIIPIPIPSLFSEMVNPLKSHRSIHPSAITVLIKNLHYLQDLVQHNHLPDATRPEVIKAVTELKKRVSETREKPVQLIQNYSISNNIQPFMPSLNALRQIVSHSKKIEKIPQTQNVLEINIPPLLRVTLN
ncbi:31006_t:CDS:1, partial [Racocetra persica]